MGAEYNKQTPGWVEKRLRKYGRNPFGKNIYRVIWSEARHEICDGKLQLEYGEFKPQWMLERWLSTEDYAGMTREQWDTQTRDPETHELILGPYPSEGFYNHCYSFGSAPLADVTVNLVCWAIEAGLGKTAAERKQAQLEAVAKKDVEHKQKISDEFDESQDSASAGAAVDRVTQPVSGRNNIFKRRDDVKVEISAEELTRYTKLPKRGFKQI